jgi:aryl-alcohol dehydrogenase-like predicted oxidoreductase
VVSLEDGMAERTSLPTYALGRTGLQISRLGFGSWAIGGGGWAFGWGPQDDRESIQTMRRALELGVNWIDTAATYGLGHSERVIGQLFRELPPTERPFIFTKCGLVWDEDRPMTPPRRVLTPESIRRECEASLTRLGVERIDLYQFHWPDETGTRVEDSWATMVDLVREGKVRAAGVSNFDVQLLARGEAIQHVDSLQPHFSLINRAAAELTIPWCDSHETGVICYSPMESGLLTESFTVERARALAADDWRRGSLEFNQPRLARNIGLRDLLRPVAQRHGTTPSAVAIAWVLAWPGVSGAIVGARSPQQVEGWIGAASLALTSEDLDEVGATIESTGAGVGPAHPETVAPQSK